MSEIMKIAIFVIVGLFIFYMIGNADAKRQKKEEERKSWEQEFARMEREEKERERQKLAEQKRREAETIHLPNGGLMFKGQTAKEVLQHNAKGRIKAK